jgi:hypothetical protein
MRAPQAAFVNQRPYASTGLWRIGAQEARRCAASQNEYIRFVRIHMAIPCPGEEVGTNTRFTTPDMMAMLLLVLMHLLSSFGIQIHAHTYVYIYVHVSRYDDAHAGVCM